MLFIIYLKTLNWFFSIKDSGEGFDFTHIVSEVDSEHSFGRGVALVKELADGLEYSENGTRVDASFYISEL